MDEQTRQRLLLARTPKPKKEKRPIAKKSVKKIQQEKDEKDLFKADKEFYMDIWNASPHKCQCGCNKGLGKEPLTTFFHHLLFKSKYPHLRHVPENIMILAPDCHNAYHTNPDNRPEIQRRQKEAEKILL